MKKKILASILLLSLAVSGCSQNKSTKTENKEDLSWLKASIQDINKDVDKQVIQEHLIEMKDGSKETTKTVYTLNKDSSIVKVDSENIENPSDRMELVYHIKGRSEEHTSELQSRQYLVCRLLLEKKKKEIENPI